MTSPRPSHRRRLLPLLALAAVFAIAQGQRADKSSLSAVSTSLDRATSIADVALSAGQQISDLLVEMREKIVNASDGSATTASKKAFNDEYQQLLKAIDQFADSSKFDGVSILDGSLSADISFLANTDGDSFVTLSRHNFTVSGSVINLDGTVLTGTTTQIKSVLARLDAAISSVSASLSELGAQAKQIDRHNVFVARLQDVLEAGIGNLVDADVAKESARLQALQVQQQLGTQALSIANQAPQIILRLFQ